MKDASDCNSRRQFLVSSAVAGGALVLARVAVAQTPETAPAVETVLKLDDFPALKTVGGYEIVEVGSEKVIVAHTEGGFIARSAICPHKFCEVEYRGGDKQFVCACHNSRFDESGKVLRGPAKTDLKPFDAAQALVVKAKTPETAK